MTEPIRPLVFQPLCHRRGVRLAYYRHVSGERDIRVECSTCHRMVLRFPVEIVDGFGAFVGDPQGSTAPTADWAAIDMDRAFIQASGSSFEPLGTGGVCVLCGARMLSGTGWVRYRSGFYAHSSCAFNLAQKLAEP